MLGSHPRESCQTCQPGSEPLLLRRRWGRGGDRIWGSCPAKMWLCFCQGRLFSPPVGRDFDGGREGSDIGSYLLNSSIQSHSSPWEVFLVVVLVTSWGNYSSTKLGLQAPLSSGEVHVWCGVNACSEKGTERSGRFFIQYKIGELCLCSSSYWENVGLCSLPSVRSSTVSVLW